MCFSFTVDTMNTLVVISLCLILANVCFAQQQYCRFTPQHTLCQHRGLGARCGSRVPRRGISAEDARFITDRHNQLRARVALGQEARGAPGPQPPASDMRVLVNLSFMWWILFSKLLVKNVLRRKLCMHFYLLFLSTKSYISFFIIWVWF